MSVEIKLEVNKEDVEMLTQQLEMSEDLEMETFIQKILKGVNDVTESMMITAIEIRKSNPYSMGCASFAGGCHA